MERKQGKKHCVTCQNISNTYYDNCFDDHVTYHELRGDCSIEVVGELYRSPGGNFIRKEVECTECGKKYDFLLS